MKTVTATLVFSILCAFPATAQQPASPMELNRAGKWAEAVTAAERLLSKPDTLSETTQCAIRSQLIYGLAHTNRRSEVQTRIAEFDQKCMGLPPGMWVRTAVDEFRGIISHATSDDWPTAQPATLGMDTVALAEHRQLCERSHADACIVVYKGSIVQEWYGPLYREPMMAMSSTKSVTGLLTGMLIADGKLAIDDPVERYIPEWKPGVQAGVTLRHLLTMTSGLPFGGEDVGSVTNKEKLAFTSELVARPGEKWAYSNNGAFLLSPLLDRAAGEPIEAYAERRLFGPLGMSKTRFHVYPDGQAWTHADLETTPRDLARIGQLMLQRGKWKDAPIVSEEWTRASVTPSQSMQPDYGLLWWIYPGVGFGARGHLDTNVYVLPAHELVIVRMQSKPAEDAVHYNPAAFDLFRRFVRN